MSVVATILSILLTLTFLGVGAGKLAGIEQMKQSADHLGVSPALNRTIGVLELAAAAGLIAGFWLQSLGLAASIGLVLLMVGAVYYHAKAKDPVSRLVPPAGLGVLAVVNAVLLGLT
ncbi:DoxX family protein [Amycolatopsis cihanbeyliensis]|uniref:DoxX-like protein n=1 Tax=Amycolatopsis cihanbeyliensis TaxID=1128664 RepID=A0A542DR38_AMYCI|nr:DoxX family protein [Amycolatopsis cihanbeyliensis]TQJ05562.1 DoxX-like protein [Amycolatopsis cihanbeyliensis]